MLLYNMSETSSTLPLPNPIPSVSLPGNLHQLFPFLLPPPSPPTHLSSFFSTYSLFLFFFLCPCLSAPPHFVHSPMAFPSRPRPSPSHHVVSYQVVGRLYIHPAASTYLYRFRKLVGPAHADDSYRQSEHLNYASVLISGT